MLGKYVIDRSASRKHLAFITTRYVLLHGFKPQLPSSFPHSIFLSVQYLTRVCVPFPHGTVHSDQSAHSTTYTYIIYIYIYIYIYTYIHTYIKYVIFIMLAYLQTYTHTYMHPSQSEAVRHIDILRLRARHG